MLTSMNHMNKRNHKQRYHVASNSQSVISIQIKRTNQHIHIAKCLHVFRDHELHAIVVQFLAQS